jgi:hypothetical protein
MANDCISCNPAAFEALPQSLDLTGKHVDLDGVVLFKPLHAYDLHEIDPGTMMYCVFNPSHNSGLKVKSLETAVGDCDCIWTGHSSQMMSEEEDMNIRLKGTFSAKSSLALNLWRKMMGFFDGVVASTDISLLPLILYPNVVCERWFSLRDGEGRPRGQILLRLKFVTKSDDLPCEDFRVFGGVRAVADKEKGTDDSFSVSGTSSVDVSRDRARSDVSVASVHTVTGDARGRLLSLESNRSRGRNDSLSSTHTYHEAPSEMEVIPIQPKLDGTESDSEMSKLAEETEVEQTALDLQALEKLLNSIDLPSEENLSPLQDAGDDWNFVEDSTSKNLLLDVPTQQPQELADETENVSPINGRLRKFSSLELFSATDHQEKQETSDDKSHAKETVTPGHNSHAKATSKATAEVSAAPQKSKSNSPKKKSQDSGADNGDIELRTVTAWMRNMGGWAQRSIRNAFIDDAKDVHEDLDASEDSDTVTIVRPNDATGVSKEEVVRENDPSLGIGKVHVHMKSARISNATDGAQGNYYVKLSIEEGDVATSTALPNTKPKMEAKTKVIRQSAAPHFNKRFLFTAPSYHCALRMSLVNADDQRPVGSARMSIYSLIIRDADLHNSNWESVGLEDIDIRDPSDNTKIVGTFKARVAFEEDVSALFLADVPRPVLDGPEESLSVERLTIHIARFQAVIAFIVSMNNEYLRLMDWEDPLYTSVAFILFVIVTLNVNAEYALSCPIFIIVAVITRSGLRRHAGRLRKKLVEKEDPEESFRPLSVLRIAVVDYKVVRGARAPSPQERYYGNISGLGSHNSVAHKRPFVRVTYSPMKESEKSEADKADEKQEHLIGCIDGHESSSFTQMVSKFSKNIIGGDMDNSQMIQNVFDPWSRSSKKSDSKQRSSLLDDDDISFVYPILQPKVTETTKEAMRVPKGHNQDPVGEATETPESVGAGKLPTFLPWEYNEGFIKIALYEHKVGNLMENLMYTSVGSVKIPIKNFIQGNHLDENVESRGDEGADEVQGWFKVVRDASDKGTLSTFDDIGLLDGTVYGANTHSHSSVTDIFNAILDGPLVVTDGGVKPSQQDTDKKASVNSPEHSGASGGAKTEESAWVYLRLQLDQSHSKSSDVPSAADKESSIALHRMLYGNESKKGGAISAIWNMRDNVTYVQNLFASILNSIESFKNIFLWTYPSKTLPIYWCLAAIWLAFVFIPGRYLILAIGLYQFLYKFIPEPEGAPWAVKFANLMKAIPNDDDLQQVYYWDRKAFVEASERKHNLNLKRAKMNILNKVLWEGEVRIKNLESWQDVYLVFGGRRLAFWGKESEIDGEYSNYYYSVPHIFAG